MSEQTLKLSDIMVNKKEFHASKQEIALNLVNTNKIVVSDKFKHSDDGSKYFIGCLHDDDVIRWCIILLQISGYIKYFDNDGKNMSFIIENEGVYLKYTEIWNKIKKSLITRFHSQPIYLANTKIKTKIEAFSSMNNTLFSGDEIPNEKNRYICIAAICIDSVLKVGKKNYPQNYLEQCKYKIKRRKQVDFIDDEVDLSSDESDDSDD